MSSTSLRLFLASAALAPAMFGCGLAGPPKCPGSSSNVVIGAPDDPKWTQPGQPSNDTACIHGTGGWLELDLPDGRVFSLHLECENGYTCTPGSHPCRKYGEAGKNDAHVTIPMLGSDPDRIKYVDNWWQAGAYGNGSPYEGTSCSYDYGIEGKRVTGKFDGTLGAMKTSDNTITNLQRLTFDFSIELQ